MKVQKFLNYDPYWYIPFDEDSRPTPKILKRISWLGVLFMIVIVIGV